MDIQHIAYFVIRMHQRYDGLFIGRGQLPLQVFHIDMSIGQELYPAEVCFSLFMKMLHRMQGGMMFQG